MKTVRKTSIPAAVGLTIALGLGALQPAQAQEETLVLRLNDAVGRPGGLTTMVFRTYASRPAGQGQICGGTSVGPLAEGIQPFASLAGVEILSPLDDAAVRARLVDDAGQRNVMAIFRSLSRTINSVDGPLAVFFLRVDPNAVPGSVFPLLVDLPNTFLIDPQGNPIPLEVVPGELQILSVADPTPIAAEGDKVEPGEPALLSFLTFEPRRLSAGQVAIEYDPSVVVGQPIVSMNPGYGDTNFTVDDLTPGLVVVNFSSPNRSLNRIPGSLIEIEVQTRADVPLGTRTPVTLNPALTFLVDRAGNLVDAFIEEGGEIEFR